MKFKTSVVLRLTLLAALVTVFVLIVVPEDEYGLTAVDRTTDLMSKNDWVGWIHPLGNNIGRVVHVGPFDSFADCEDYSWSRINNEYRTWEDAEYFCGYSCSDTDHDLRESACKVVR